MLIQLKYLFISPLSSPKNRGYILVIVAFFVDFPLSSKRSNPSSESISTLFVPAATKMLLYSFLSEQSPETVVKIPSFPFGEGVGTSGQCHPVPSLLWVSGKAPAHTHTFLVHTHPSPGLRLSLSQGLYQCLVRKHEGFRGEF